jgi:hypothetical protein
VHISAIERMGMGDDNAFLRTVFFKASFDFVPIGKEADFFFHVLIRPVNLLQKRFDVFTI